MTGPDMAASVRARLLNKAKAEQQEWNYLCPPSTIQSPGIPRLTPPVLANGLP
jgi:hypothetical protein